MVSQAIPSSPAGSRPPRLALGVARERRGVDEGGVPAQVQRLLALDILGQRQRLALEGGVVLAERGDPDPERGEGEDEGGNREWLHRGDNLDVAADGTSASGSPRPRPPTRRRASARWARHGPHRQRRKKSGNSLMARAAGAP